MAGVINAYCAPALERIAAKFGFVSALVYLSWLARDVAICTSIVAIFEAHKSFVAGSVCRAGFSFFWDSLATIGDLVHSTVAVVVFAVAYFFYWFF